MLRWCAWALVVVQVGVTEIVLAISYRADVMMEFLREIESLVRLCVFRAPPPPCPAPNTHSHLRSRAASCSSCSRMHVRTYE